MKSKEDHNLDVMHLGCCTTCWGTHILSTQPPPNDAPKEVMEENKMQQQAGKEGGVEERDIDTLVGMLPDVPTQSQDSWVGFDLFDLIPEGIAIDKSTLKQ